MRGTADAHHVGELRRPRVRHAHDGAHELRVRHEQRERRARVVAVPVEREVAHGAVEERDGEDRDDDDGERFLPGGRWARAALAPRAVEVGRALGARVGCRVVAFGARPLVQRARRRDRLAPETREVRVQVAKLLRVLESRARLAGRFIVRARARLGKGPVARLPSAERPRRAARLPPTTLFGSSPPPPLPDRVALGAARRLFVHGLTPKATSRHVARPNDSFRLRIASSESVVTRVSALPRSRHTG